MKSRCGKCQACKRVEEVQQQALRALNSRWSSNTGEDVRLIWNRTLEENPCEQGKEGETEQ